MKQPREEGLIAVSGFVIYSWVRGARIGLTTDIGLLEEF